MGQDQVFGGVSVRKGFIPMCLHCSYYQANPAIRHGSILQISKMQRSCCLFVYIEVYVKVES